MKKILFSIFIALLCQQTFAQDYVDPKSASKKAEADAWAAAIKAKAANDAAVAAQRAAEAAKKVPPETKVKIHVYDGKGNK